MLRFLSNPSACASNQLSGKRTAGVSPGFTLVELLVVIAILGLLVALLLPAVQAARESARRSKCLNNLRQVGIGLHDFHDSNEQFPSGSYRHSGQNGRLRIAWSVFLLPHIEQQNVWDQFDISLPYNAEANRLATQQRIAIYLCPSVTTVAWDRVEDTTGDLNGNGQYDPGDGMYVTDYGGIYGSGNVWPPPNGILLYDEPISIAQITDGTSQTLIVAEDTGRGTRWHGAWATGDNIFDQTGPINATQHNEIFSDHPGGALALRADGSVSFMNESTETRVLDALCTRANGDIVPEQ